ncbi:asparagine synthase-related protein [Streptomyces sp. CSDS2]|uniref:asparagine synthase-related protein n=1 Tax=Streptomyces sp. CSDS2 TaxID=3055051 RepID=UPI0025B1A535|nr:asparagine synthase-related protein [Streptomyces sp. CSDS2]MDN3261187.1 asparagine synthase-related protein [Streptomyces sp. CSDS2]
MPGHLPDATGFALTATPAGSAAEQPGTACFATAGPTTAVTLRAGDWLWTGFLVSPAGSTPLPGVATDGPTTVLLAGELYNQDELVRAVGDPKLADAGDAWLLLACLRRYGPHAFRLVNGRFAALTADGGVLVAATDHCGGVPLYLAVDAASVSVATEAKALPTMADGPHGQPVTGLRPLRGTGAVHQVPAGGGVVVEAAAGRPRTRLLRTWTPPLHRRHLPEEEALREVREALDRAVRSRLRTGPAPTAVLSGGIDSSAVAALTASACPGLRTVSMGTDLRDEFREARLVADHLARAHPGPAATGGHTEIRIDTADLLAELPWTIWASECTDPDVVEYLLPLAALYRRLPADRPLRILTGYGADIPLGGMHRDADRLAALDDAVAHDMETFDGLNEMSPVLSGAAGHWTTHPYWDRDLLERLLTLEAGLKRRHGRDKWVLREAVADLLPAETVGRPKLGVHEGSGTTSSFTLLLREHGVPDERIGAAKGAVVRRLYDRLVAGGAHPDEIDLGQETKAALHRPDAPGIEGGTRGT